jgi:hypothetical protein
VVAGATRMEAEPTSQRFCKSKPGFLRQSWVCQGPFVKPLRCDCVRSRMASGSRTLGGKTKRCETLTLWTAMQGHWEPTQPHKGCAAHRTRGP